MAEETFLIFPGTAVAEEEVDPIDVFGVAILHGVGVQTVNNPGAGSGGEVLAIATVASPGLDSTGSWVSPTGTWETVFDYEPDPGSFVPRCRVLKKVDEGELDFTFGWSGGAFESTQSCAIVVLDGETTSVVATAQPTTNTATSSGFPGLASEDGMLILPMAAQQEADDLTDGPGTELINNTASTANRGLFISKLRADSASTQVNPATWNGSTGAHVQWVIGAVGVGGQGANQLIPSTEWTALVEASRPDTWMAARNCQLIHLGNRFQDGDIADDINDPAAGYGKSFDGANELHSFALEGNSDGEGLNETLRLGPVNRAGLINRPQVLRQWHQFRVADGYDESQETASGQNNSTAYPGTDRTYFDGTRCQWSFIPINAADPKAIQASFGGATGDRVIMSSMFFIEKWMLANDLQAFGGGVHASGSAPSPWTQMVGQGELRIITRDQTTPWTSGNNNPNSGTRAATAITAGDVGDPWAVIQEFIIDPIDGYLRVWVAKADGGFNLLYEKTNGYGLSYADTDPNQSLWYALLANFYSWHRADSSVATFNWDETYGTSRRVDYAYSGFKINPTFDVNDVMRHANYDLIGA